MIGPEGFPEHFRHAYVMFDRRRRRRVDRLDRHPADEPVHCRLLHLDLAERRQDRTDVGQEGRVGADDQHAGPPEPFAMQVEKVGGAVQADRGLSGAGRALHADRVVQLGPDELVLLGLDGRHDVAHRPDARPLDLGGQDAALGAQLLAAVEVLVLEAGQLAPYEAEAPAGRDALRVAHAGPVEGAGERGPPVEHHRLAQVVGDVPPADVIGGVVDVEPAEEEGGGRVVGQFGHSAGHVAAQLFGGVGVPGDLGAGAEQGFGPAPHSPERGPGLGEVVSFGG
jgi:hypothetical protein